MKTLDEVTEYLNRIFKSRWFKKHYPAKTWFTLGDGRRARIARGGHRGYSGVYLKLPRWARSEYVVLHELSHGVTPTDKAAHGREFARNLLLLVKRWMGEEDYKKLKQSFRLHRVKFTPKRGKRPWKLLPNGEIVSSVSSSTGTERLGPNEKVEGSSPF